MDQADARAYTSLFGAEASPASLAVLAYPDVPGAAELIARSVDHSLPANEREAAAQRLLELDLIATRARLASGDRSECPACGREGCERTDCRPAPALVVESAGRFLERAQAGQTWLIPELVPEAGMAMFHGRPRSMKSLSALALAASAALGRPVFGAARFAVERPLRCCYMTEEDGHGLVAARLRWLLAGLEAPPPETLWLSARRGLTLEDAASQTAIHDVVRELEAELLIFDTGRAFAPSLDKGPADGAAAIHFLRALLSGTALRGLVVVHHDTKPGRDGKDERGRAERASGGALLAAIDCPIGFERLSDRAALAVPDRYKVSADPKPFRLTFESATPSGESFRDWLRVSAEETDERAEASTRLDAAVLQVLTDSWQTTGNIAGQVRGRRADVIAALGRLVDLAQAEHRPAARGSREYRLGPEGPEAS